MTRRRLFDDPRDIDLHFDEPLRTRRKVADEPPIRRPINSFPPIEFTTQRTRQAVYCLVRGIGESIEQSSASAVAGWLSGAKGIAVSRHGPSVYPGPDGSQYEWFFRLESVDGDKLRSLDEVYESSRRRLANRPVSTEVAVVEPQLTIEDDAGALDLPLADISRTEIARIAGHLAREVQRLHRLLATRLRLIWQLRKSAAMASSVQVDASADHTVLDQMWAELTLRDKDYSAKEESLVERESALVTRVAWIEAQYAQLSATPMTDKTVTESLERLLPRIVLDGESTDLIQYELLNREAYIRFLGAMNDRCEIATHPCCKKHEKVKEGRGKIKLWWEVRLIDNVAEDHRLYYRHSDDDRLEVCVRHKKDQQRFFAQL